MSSKRLEDRVNSQVKKLSNGRLHKFSLKFHKRSRQDKSGKCNALFTDNQDDCVIGVIFQIDKEKEKVSLLKKYASEPGFRLSDLWLECSASYSCVSSMCVACSKWRATVV